MRFTRQNLAGGLMFALIVLNEALANMIGPFRLLDEGIALFCLGYLIVQYGNANKLKYQGFRAAQRKFIQNDVVAIGVCTALMFAIAISGNVIYQYQPSWVAIGKDVLAFLKMPITLLACILMNQNAKDDLLNSAAFVSRWLLTIMAVCGVITLKFDIGMAYATRRNIPTFRFLYSHPTFLVYAAVLMVCVLVAKDASKNKFFILEGIFIMLLTQRDKAFAFIVLLMVLLCVPDLKKLKLRYVVIAGLGALAISYPKLKEYQSWTWSPREELHRTGFKILRDCFPIGSGFATYGSSLSGEYYSKIYQAYNIHEKPGMNPQDYVNLSDAQWPYYLGEFGLVGILLFFTILLTVFLLIRKIYQTDKNKLKAAYLLLGYLAVGSLVENVFTNESGVTCMVVLFLFLGSNTIAKQYLSEKEAELIDSDIVNQSGQLKEKRRYR